MNDDNELQEERQEWSDYTPLLQEGKVWVYGTNPYFEKKAEVYKDYLDGDTIINGRSYMKLYSQPLSDSRTQYIGAVRELGKKVFFVGAGSTEEQLKYDFGMAVGERMQLSDSSSVRVESVTDTENQNIRYRCLSVVVEYDNEQVRGQWIEGIGTWLPGLCNSDGFGAAGISRRLYYCEYQGRKIYEATLPPVDGRGDMGRLTGRGTPTVFLLCFSVRLLLRPTRSPSGGNTPEGILHPRQAEEGGTIRWNGGSRIWAAVVASLM